MANFELHNNNNDVLSLSDRNLWPEGTWRMILPGWEPRTQTSARFSQYGAEVTGDGRVGTRSIRFTFNVVKGREDDPHRAAFNLIPEMFRPEFAPYWLHDTDNDIRCRVTLSNFRPQGDGETLYRAHVDNTMELTMLDASWEDIEETVLQGSIGDGDTLAISVTGMLEAYPVITIIALDITEDFEIINETNGRSVAIGDFDFIPGTSMELDSRHGTVTLKSDDGDIDKATSIATGGMISFEPGTNMLRYEGEAAEYDIRFRGRYVY